MDVAEEDGTEKRFLEKEADACARLHVRDHVVAELAVFIQGLRAVDA
jgi:hypothetical protein